MQLCAMLSSTEYHPGIELTNKLRLMILKCMPVGLCGVYIGEVAAWTAPLPSARAGAHCN